MQQLLWLPLLFLLLACQQAEQPPAPPPPAPPLLTVGDRQLSLAEFNRELERSYPDLQQLPTAERLALQKQLLQRLIERELLLGEAARQNIQITPEELDQELQALRGRYSVAEYDRVLAAGGQTRSGWQKVVKQRKLIEKVTAAASTPVAAVTDQELKDYFWVNRDHFRRPLQLRARQMLLPDRDTAEQLRQRILAGEDFAALARQHSLSPDREEGGDLGNLARGQLPREFDQVLFELPPGQVSAPVESPYGYHLFLVEHRRRAGLRLLEEVADEIRETLLRERRQAAFQQWFSELRGRTPVTIDWAQLAPATARPAGPPPAADE